VADAMEQDFIGWSPNADIGEGDVWAGSCCEPVREDDLKAEHISQGMRGKW
jgi:hypothetical protein